VEERSETHIFILSFALKKYQEVQRTQSHTATDYPAENQSIAQGAKEMSYKFDPTEGDDLDLNLSEGQSGLGMGWMTDRPYVDYEEFLNPKGKSSKDGVDEKKMTHSSAPSGEV